MVRRQPHPDWNLQQLFCPCDRLLHRRQRHERHRHVAARVQCRPGQDVHCERRVWSHFDEWTLPSHSDTFRFESHRRSDVVHHRLELRRRERHVDRDVLEYFLKGFLSTDARNECGLQSHSWRRAGGGTAARWGIHVEPCGASSGRSPGRW